MVGELRLVVGLGVRCVVEGSVVCGNKESIGVGGVSSWV